MFPRSLLSRSPSRQKFVRLPFQFATPPPRTSRHPPPEPFFERQPVCVFCRCYRVRSAVHIYIYIYIPSVKCEHAAVKHKQSSYSSRVVATPFACTVLAVLNSSDANFFQGCCAWANLAGYVGSDRIGSGRVGSDRVGSGRRIESGPVASVKRGPTRRLDFQNLQTQLDPTGEVLNICDLTRDSGHESSRALF